MLAPLAAAGLLAATVLAVVGLPPVDLHGPLHYLGVMDPLCGMTRGTVAVLRGRLGQAVAFNPASPLLVAGALLADGPRKRKRQRQARYAPPRSSRSFRFR